MRVEDIEKDRQMEVWIKDMEKVENKNMVKEDEKMDDKKGEGVEIIKEIKEKEEGNEDNEKTEGWSPTVWITMGSYQRSPASVQKQK